MLSGSPVHVCVKLVCLSFSQLRILVYFDQLGAPESLYKHFLPFPAFFFEIFLVIFHPNTRKNIGKNGKDQKKGKNEKKKKLSYPLWKLTSIWLSTSILLLIIFQ